MRKPLFSRENDFLLMNYLVKKNALFFLFICKDFHSLKIFSEKNPLEKTSFKIKIENTTVLRKTSRQKRPFQKREAEGKRGEKTRKKKNPSRSLMFNLRDI